MHRVRRDDAAAVAEAFHRLPPRGPHHPRRRLDNILDNDRVVADLLSEPGYVPHRRPRPFGRRVRSVPQRRVLPPPRHPPRLRMIRALGTREQHAGPRVPSRVRLADVRTVVARVGEMRLVYIDRGLPVVGRDREGHPGGYGADRGAARAAEQIRDGDAGHDASPGSWSSPIGPIASIDGPSAKLDLTTSHAGIVPSGPTHSASWR